MHTLHSLDIRRMPNTLHPSFFLKFGLLCFLFFLIVSSSALDADADAADVEADLGPELRQDALEREKKQLEEQFYKRKTAVVRVLKLRRRLNYLKSQQGKLATERGNEESTLQQKKALIEEREKSRHSTAAERKLIEENIGTIKSEVDQLQDKLNDEEGKKKNLDQDFLRLERERENLVRKAQELTETFKKHGLQNWMESNINMFPEVVRATLFQTGTLLEPVVEAVEEAAEVNGKLTEDVAEQLTHYLPMIRKSPFYSGVLFYIMLLFPLVLSVALIIRVKSRLALLSMNHYILAGNLYFGVLSVVCFIMSILSGTDILIVFQHRSRGTAESFIVLHAFFYIFHIVLHGADAYSNKNKRSFGQFVCVLSIGVHFYSHAYKRSILHQDPHIGAWAYFIYSVLFLYTLYDRGANLIEVYLSARNRYKNVNGSGHNPKLFQGVQTYYTPVTGTSRYNAARDI